MNRYDTVIIGTGPAGISAAITAKIRNKSLLLIGSPESSKKLATAHEINNYPGFPAVKGSDLRDALLEHLKAMDIAITDERVTLIYPMGSYFMLQSDKGMYESSTVILATGMIAAKPYPGEDENLGNGVSYCATCDAPLYKGKSAIVIAGSPEEEAEAVFLSEYADKVSYLPLYKDEVSLPDNIEIIRETPLSIAKADGKMILTTSNGERTTDGVFILRESVAPGKLVPGLETDGPHVKCDRSLATNVPGLFVCGDVAGKPYQYIKAAGEGNVAALSMVSYLQTIN